MTRRRDGGADGGVGAEVVLFVPGFVCADEEGWKKAALSRPLVPSCNKEPLRQARESSELEVFDEILTCVRLLFVLIQFHFA